VWGLVEAGVAERQIVQMEGKSDERAPKCKDEVGEVRGRREKKPGTQFALIEKCDSMAAQWYMRTSHGWEASKQATDGEGQKYLPVPCLQCEEHVRQLRGTYRVSQTGPDTLAV